MPSKKSFSPDWFVRGILTKVGDTFDRLTGRGWKPSSSLATSELVERLKALLDSEVENTDGRGNFVPHNIQLKMQWDKFSTDSDESLQKLENELMTAAIDHINDRRYYTYQPLSIEVKPDYFTSGVKLFVSFEKIVDESDGAAMNVIVPGTNTTQISADDEAEPPKASQKYVLRFNEKGKPKTLEIVISQEIRKGIGRTKENDISIDDPSVSKHHASLTLNNASQLIVADTGSTNGTFINGRRIAYGKAEPVNSGDKLNFGTVEVSFENIPMPVIEQPVRPTQAETVSIDGFEFSSKIEEHSDLRIPSPESIQIEKTMASNDWESGTSDPGQMQKTIASSEAVLLAPATGGEKTNASADTDFDDVAPKTTESRIEFDFAEHKPLDKENTEE